MSFRLLPLILFFICIPLFSIDAADIKSDLLFIKFEEEVQSRVLASHGLTDSQPAFPKFRNAQRRGNSKLDRIYISRITSGDDPKDVAGQISEEPGIEYAEPVPVYRTLSSPDDPKYVDGSQSYLDQINAPQAWNITTGSEEVTIAIIDTGTDIDHVDLADNTWINPDEEKDDEDNSGSGKVDDINGWDFYEDNNDPRPDTDEHGTHVAGIAAAVTNNSEGVASLGHSVSYMPLKAGDGSGSFSGQHAYQAMLYAAEQGAEVINCSWGGTSFSETASRVVSEVYEMGSVIIAAAGNDGDEQVFYPAGYPEVTAVASVDENMDKTGFSNFGPFVGVAAPGEDIYSTFNDDKYGRSSGTSMSAPVVSALAGLIASHHQDFDNDQIRAQIKATASGLTYHTEDKWREQLGEGMIDAGSALGDPAPYLLPSNHIYTVVEGDAPPSFSPATAFDLHIDWHNLGIDLSGAEVTFETFAPGLPEDDDLHDAVVPPNSSVSLGSFESGEIIEAAPVEFNITGQAAGRNDERIIIQANVKSGGETIASPTFEVILNPNELVMNANSIELTMGSTGRIGWQDYPNFEEGQSFVIPTFGSQEIDERWADQPLLREGGLMFADSPNASSTRVSNSIRRSEEFADDHFVTRDPFTIESDPDKGIQRSTVSFTDGGASDSYNVITQLTAKSVSDEDFNQVILLNYRFTNDGDETLHEFQPGLFLDWVLPLNTGNPAALQENMEGNINEDDHIIYVSEWDEEDALFTGATMVEPLDRGYLISNSGDPGIFGIQEEFTREDKALTLSYGIRTLGDLEEPRDISMVAGPPSFSLEPGESEEATWVVGWGIGYEGLARNLIQGREYAAEVFTSSVDETTPEQPAASEISKTYPNPFNARSTIELNVAEQGYYEVELINTLGQKVMQLETSELSPGTHSLSLNGSQMATGVYRLLLRRNGEVVDSKGVTLMK